MKIFAALITFVPNMVERRQPYREGHLAYLRQLKAAGNLLMAGAWTEPVDGALIVYHGENENQVRQMIEADPYHKAGLWPEFQIREWSVVIS